MIPLVLALAAPKIAAPKTAALKTVTLAPTDDVWVYPHASDPGRDEALRVWGSAGRAVTPEGEDAADFSYGYLRFEIPADMKGKLTGATLEVTNVPNPEMTAAMGQGSPIEVRPLVGTFSEKDWTYTDAIRTVPDAKVVFGKGAPAFRGDESPAVAKINLLGDGSAFRVEPGKPLFLALVSGVDAAEVGMKRIYKLYSKDATDPARRPKLTLTLAE